MLQISGENCILIYMENLTNTELDLALKLNKHKIFLQRFFIFSLAFIDLLIMYNLWYRWIVYSSETPGAMHDELNPKQQINFAEYHARNAPLPLSIEQENNLASGVNQYDYYAIIRNPNPRWLGSGTTIEFRFPTETRVVKLSNLLPGESRIAALFGKTSSGSEAFLVEIKDTVWTKIRSDIPSVSDWIAVENPRYEPSDAVPNYAETAFTLHNRSTYGLWNVPYTILLYSGNSLVGLNQLSTTHLDPGEQRPIKSAWTNLPVPVDRVEVRVDPTIVLDSSNRYLEGVDNPNVPNTIR